MRENAQPARPTLADRQVPDSSSTEHGHLSPLLETSIDEQPKSSAPLPAESIVLGDEVPLGWMEVVELPVEAGGFDVFKIAENGEPILVEGVATLEAAVAR